MDKEEYHDEDNHLKISFEEYPICSKCAYEMVPKIITVRNNKTLIEWECVHCGNTV